MHIPGISLLNGNGLTTGKKPNSVLAWSLTVIGCLYCLWVYLALASAIPIFDKLFSGMGMPLPLLTRIVLGSYFWLLPVLCIVAVTLIVARQFVLSGKVQLHIANVILIFVGAVLPAIVIFAMYLPLIVLTHKLDAAH